MNLWNPAHLPWLLALATAGLLGMVHGITPDEHTWPITFSYSIGSYSSRGGRRVGLLFSLAFTVQRALASELAYFALTAFQLQPRWQFGVYLVVGLVMVGSGVYILRRGRAARWELGGRVPKAKDSTRWLPLLHGFIAGWGVGAFATIIYTVLSPAMPSPWLGWLPGALFGLGTMLMQIVLGGVFGAWMARRHLSDKARAYVARTVSGRTLAGGGIAFVAVAAAGLAWPSLVASLAVTTPLHVHNLHTIGAGFFLAVVALFGIAGWAFVKSRREALRLFGPGSPGTETSQLT
ncbi:MAG: hypothetical protein M0Z53_11925 [Thermaerobacter sp.]|nr:hypothetical protein [Thermaerobacter sp.]